MAAVRSRFHGQAKKINDNDACGHNADSGLDLCLWPSDDATFRQDFSTPFNILIESEATDYSYSICIRNFKVCRLDFQFERDSIFVPSLQCAPTCDREIAV